MQRPWAHLSENVYALPSGAFCALQRVCPQAVYISLCVSLLLSHGKNHTHPQYCTMYVLFGGEIAQEVFSVVSYELQEILTDLWMLL